MVKKDSGALTKLCFECNLFYACDSQHRSEHGCEGQERLPLISWFPNRKEQSFKQQSVVSACDSSGRQAGFESSLGLGWVFTQQPPVLPGVLARSNMKCQLPCVKSVQPASNQNPHSQPNIPWQLSKPCSFGKQFSAQGCLEKGVCLPVCLYVIQWTMWQKWSNSWFIDRL